MELINALNWRYAVKRMNGEKVPEEKISNILEATRLSASSMGLQPYKVLVVQNKELKEKLLPAINNQPQVIESSHLLIFAAYNDVTEQDVQDYINQIASVRDIPHTTLEGFKKSLLNIVHNKSQEEKYQWAARQTYIAFGTAIVAAAVEEVDATPMEGFSPAAVDEILNLSARGLRSVTILALGYRNAEKDPLARAKKVRKSKKQIIEEFA